MPTVAGIWTEPFRVRAYETDPHGLASIQTLCNYFQEAAGKHARAYGVSIDQLLEHDLTWVLSRLRVHIEAAPVWGDTVRLETWPAGVEGLYAMRDFIFYTVSDEEHTPRCVGRGTSAWLVVDVHRKRPVRVPPSITEIILPERERALPDAFTKLRPPPRAEHEARFRVRYSDLDINQHVNNVRYAEWAVESVPDAILHDYRLRDLDLQYRAETTFGDTVIAQAQQAPPGDAPVFDHQLLREHDGRTVALAQTHWVRRTT
ncbi:MAG: acyl-[acyl-carrier-protein] thioesterase [Rhodothermales bacterium]